MPKPSITYSDDSVLLEFAPPSVAGAATTALPGGGTLAVDPLEPARLLRVTLDSTDLDDLAGVLNVRLGAPPEAGTQPIVGWEPEPRLAALQRLAFANWYAQYTPLDVEGMLLDLDVAREAWSAGHRVNALERFSGTADHLLELINIEVAAGGALAQEVVDRLQETAQACVASLGEDDPRSAQIHEAAESLEVSPPPRLQELQPSFVAGATMYGSTMSIAPPASVDWDLVEPRTLATDEGTILMSQVDDEVTVSVAAHPRLDPESPGSQRLIVRLLDARSGDPIIAAPLEYMPWSDDRAASFQAKFPASGFDWDQVIPDVVDAALLHPAGMGTARSEALARRASIRAIAWSRLGAIASSLNDEWVQYFRGAPSRRLLIRSLAELPANSPPVQTMKAWVIEADEDLSSALPTPALLSELMFISREVRAQVVR